MGIVCYIFIGCALCFSVIKGSTLARLKNQLLLECLKASDSSNLTLRVHFSASIKSTTILSKNEKVIFDDVLVNHGNAYNEHSGVFVCPADGSYQFSWAVMKTLATRSHINLMVNGKLELYTWSPGQHNREMSIGSLILKLKKGDAVWLATFKDAVGVHGGRHSSFTGQSL